MERGLGNRVFGVYVREGDLWHLEHLTYREVADLAKDVNESFGVETLIAGPWASFPRWLEP